LPDIYEGRVGGGGRPESSLSWWWDNEFGGEDADMGKREEVGADQRVVCHGGGIMSLGGRMQVWVRERRRRNSQVKHILEWLRKIQIIVVTAR
jgi:hypothetical protein